MKRFVADELREQIANQLHVATAANYERIIWYLAEPEAAPFMAEPVAAMGRQGLITILVVPW